MEYFFSDNVSIFAEYEAKALYKFEKDRNRNSSSSTEFGSEKQTVAIYTSSAEMGLSIYLR